jgi:hypothetical protein
MANTFEAIATVTVGSPTALIDFTSIPQSYTDLAVKISARTPAVTSQLDVLIDMNASVNQTNWRIVQGDGSGAYSATASNTLGRGGVIPAGNATANMFCNVEIYIPNYTSSNQKSYSSDSSMENNTTSSYNEFIAGLYTQTTAITSIRLSVTSGNNFSQYSTATLYGIKNS